MQKTSLIFGISGQVGSLLARHLVGQGGKVHGTSREATDFANLSRVGIRELVTVHRCDPTNFSNVAQTIENVAPTEIYNLSAQSSVGLSFERPYETFQSVQLANLNILEALRLARADVRFCHAASGESFGETELRGANEDTPFRPLSPYGVAKAAAFWSTVNYRKSYGLFAASAILFNHESPLRPERFVTRKIIKSAAAIARGEMAGPLRLGNLDIRRDWGWAADYADAMCRIVRAPVADDFVIATGQSYTLREFVSHAFAAFGLDWQDHVASVKELHRPSEATISTARPERARQYLGWTASHAMPEVIQLLAAAEQVQN